MNNNGIRLGLALSGGAVRGLAHLGVLSVLTQAGIAIDYMAGSSAGAVIGAAFCAGMSAEQIQAVAPNISWRHLVRPSFSSRGLLDFARLERWIVMMLGDLDFADLKIPLAVVAMDLESGERVVIREGRLAPAIRASCSVPGIVAPLRVDGRLLGDGGIVDNLPVDAARDLGAQIVVGVDVFEPSYGRRWWVLGQGLTTLETLVRHAGGGVGQADILICPNTAGRTYLRFSKHSQLAALGAMAARECLPRLLAVIEYRQQQIGEQP